MEHHPLERRARLTGLRRVLTEEADVDGDLVAPRRDLWRHGAALAAGHALVADAAVAVVVAVISTPWLVHHSRLGPSAWALQAGLVVPLVWRRRFPVAVFTVVSAVAFIQWLIGAVLVADVALLVSLYTVAAHRPRIVALGAAAIVEVGAVMAAFRWGLAGSWLRSLVFLSGLIAAAALLGANLRSRRSRLATLVERADRLERERDQQALIAAAAERTRIAREMHDVIAHSLAVIISLADGASAKLPADPERAAAAIQSLSEIGRQALGDTRRLLGVLRAGDASDGLAPQPGVAQIAGLLDRVRATGLDATMVTVGSPHPMPAGAELTAFRIVQEATTNTLKHSVGATVVVVTLEFGRDALHITVTDDGRPTGQPHPADAPPHGGHGLAGMRERAAIYRGHVTAGPSLHGWTVDARLTLNPAVPTLSPTVAVAPPPLRAPAGPHR